MKDEGRKTARGHPSATLPSAFFLSAARWLFLGLLVYAPWAYGCTRPWAIAGLNAGLAVVLGLWALGAGLRGRRPAGGPPWPWGVLAGLLLAQGWWMTLNAGFVRDGDYLLFVPIRAGLWPGAPGSIEAALSRDWMWRGTLLLGASAFVAAEIAPRADWLRRLWQTVGVAGASTALLGLVQRASGAENIFWAPAPLDVANEAPTFFGAYRYHANAGAFLNLTFPLVAGLFLRALARPPEAGGTVRARAGWGGALGVMLLAIAANTSKAAQLLAVPLLAAVLLGPARPFLRGLPRVLAGRGWVTLALPAALALGLVGAVVWTVGLDRPLARWGQVFVQVQAESRWPAAGVTLDALRQDPRPLGLGPGTFQAAFPYYTGPVGNRLEGRWTHLHEDYLQTALEWGWVGAALWGALFFGGLGAGAWWAWSRGETAARVRRAWHPRQRVLLPLVVLALGGVALHALVDFPLQIASLQLYVAAYLGLCWGAAGWGRGAAPANGLTTHGNL